MIVRCLIWRYTACNYASRSLYRVHHRNKKTKSGLYYFPKKALKVSHSNFADLTGKHLKKVLKPFACRRAFKRLKNQRLQQLRCEGEKKKNAERITMQCRICQVCTAVSQIRLKQRKLQKKEKKTPS